jgi:AcrR family transcriptional regulator
MKQKNPYRSELRAEQAAATRERIVKAAADQFAPSLSELRFDDVAAKARVSVRTVYRYFPTQSDLLDAVMARIIEGSGWNPEATNADNLGAMTAHAFAYYGTLLESRDQKPEADATKLAGLRAQRLQTIERIVAPYTEGMEPEMARGICAVVAGLVRIQFLQAMHEQWGLDGAQSGRAVAWALDTLLDELRRKEGKWNRK